MPGIQFGEEGRGLTSDLKWGEGGGAAEETLLLVSLYFFGKMRGEGLSPSPPPSPAVPVCQFNQNNDIEIREEEIIVDFCFCRSALEYCQEAAAILEQLSDRVDGKDEEENLHSCLLDRLGAVYLWQSLLEHKGAMEEKSTSAMPELSDSYQAEEVHKSCSTLSW